MKIDCVDFQGKKTPCIIIQGCDEVMAFLKENGLKYKIFYSYYTMDGIIYFLTKAENINGDQEHR